MRDTDQFVRDTLREMGKKLAVDAENPEHEPRTLCDRTRAVCNLCLKELDEAEARKAKAGAA